MKSGQATKIYGYSPVRLNQLAGLGLGAIALLALVQPSQLMAQETKPAADAVVPPVRRESPKMPQPAEMPAPAPEAKKSEPEPKTQYAPPPPEYSGVFGSIQEWLARANREYQGIVVKQLSKPSEGAPAEDEIAKKLNEQQTEDNRKAQEQAEAAAKAAEHGKLNEDRKRAEETKRLADEAKKRADEVLKAEQSAAETAKHEEAAAAERQRIEAEKEAQKLADEARREEQKRRAEETRRANEERERAHAAEAVAAAAAAQHRSRTVELTTEPITRPTDPGTMFRPELATPESRRAMRLAQSADDDVSPPSNGVRRVRFYREARGTHRGTAVKRWVWRADGRCRSAGRRITPPARYTIKRGDSLWRISERHYNAGRLYPKIYRANRASISDPDLIYPCQRVFVPRRR